MEKCTSRIKAVTEDDVVDFYTMEEELKLLRWVRDNVEVRELHNSMEFLLVDCALIVFLCSKNS